mgnify:CR=1 FL=1
MARADPGAALLSVGVRAKARRRSNRWRDLPAAVLMLAPSLILLSVFVLYTLVRAVWLGQQRCDAQGNNCTSSGWVQYIDVIRSNEFRNSVAVTFKFAVITVPIGLALGVALAALGWGGASLWRQRERFRVS